MSYQGMAQPPLYTEHTRAELALPNKCQRVLLSAKLPDGTASNFEIDMHTLLKRLAAEGLSIHRCSKGKELCSRPMDRSYNTNMASCPPEDSRTLSGKQRFSRNQAPHASTLSQLAEDPGGNGLPWGMATHLF